MEVVKCVTFIGESVRESCALETRAILNEIRKWTENLDKQFIQQILIEHLLCAGHCVRC